MLKENSKNVLQCDKCVYMNNHNTCINYEYMIDPFNLSMKIIKEKNNILNFIHYLNINDFNNELSKYLINLIFNKSTNDYSLITESIIHDNLIRSKINIEKEEITNELLNDLLIYNYKKEIKEMKYFLVLFYYNMTHEDCQRYFLDCFVYQCKERITYTKEYYNYLNKNTIIHSNTFTDHILLYNTSLLYSLLISNENKEKHVLSLINNELMINYNKKEGCLCYYNDKLNYYRRVKETEFYFSDICFCQKEFRKIELNLNEVFFTREPIKIYTREEKIIAYLMWRSNKSNIKERNMILGGILQPNLDILDKIVQYFFNKEKVIKENVSGDENEEFNDGNERMENNEESKESIEEEMSSEDEINDDMFSEEEVTEESNDDEMTDEKVTDDEIVNEDDEMIDEENREEDLSNEEELSSCSFSSPDAEIELDKELSNEEEDKISETVTEKENISECNEIESINELNEEIGLVNEENELIINDLQNNNVSLEVNYEQSCKEAVNYFTMLEEEKIKEINKEEFFIALKNNLPDNKKNKYKGDFRSGKRINMKRIVTYFMSDYQRDKIFMRRIKECKKEYKINIYVDNSKSMLKYKLEKQLIYLYDLLNYSFNKLNLEFKLFSFGEETKEINELILNFNEERSNITYHEGYTIVLTDGIINNMKSTNALYLFLNKELKNMKQVICDNEIRIVNYLEMLNVKYCLVYDDNFIDEFSKALSELIRE